MTDEELILADANKNHVGVPIDIIYKAFYNVKKNPTVHIYRHNNSMLFIDTDGDFHFVNAAPFKEFIINIQATFAEAKQDGFTILHTNFTNPRIIDAAIAAKVDYDVIKDGETYLMNVRL